MCKSTDWEIADEYLSGAQAKKECLGFNFFQGKNDLLNNIRFEQIDMLPSFIKTAENLENTMVVDLSVFASFKRNIQTAKDFLSDLENLLFSSQTKDEIEEFVRVFDNFQHLMQHMESQHLELMILDDGKHEETFDKWLTLFKKDLDSYNLSLTSDY